MTDKEKLYELMGELIYAVAKADGVIQEEETDKLKEILADHEWAKDIQWSFDYEVGKGNSVEDIYDKVIYYCKNYGPTPEYLEFISAMKAVAAASDGVDRNESSIINAFSKDLLEKFNKDIDELMEK